MVGQLKKVINVINITLETLSQTAGSAIGELGQFWCIVAAAEAAEINKRRCSRVVVKRLCASQLPTILARYLPSQWNSDLASKLLQNLVANHLLAHH